MTGFPVKLQSRFWGVVHINQLKAGAILSYISLGLHNIIGLLYIPFLLRMLGQSEYGLYALAASVIAYLTVLDFGFGNAIVRFTSKMRAEGKLEEQYSLFGMFIIIFAIIGLLVLTIGIGLYFNVDTLFNRTMTIEELEKARIMVLLLSANLAVTFFFSIFGSIITAHEKFVFQKMLIIIRIVLQPCIMMPLLFMGYKAVTMVVIITLLNISTLLINTYYCFAILKIKVHFTKFKWSLLKEIGGYSFYIFIGILVDKIWWSTGQFVLGAIVGTTAVAVYAIAMQFKDFYRGFSVAISSVFLPRITTMITNKSSLNEISNLFIRVGRIQFIILSFFLSGFIIFGQAFVEFWAGNEYSEAYTIALIVMLPLTVACIQNIGVTILQASNQHKFRSIMYLCIAVASVALSIPLARKYGGIGCALAIAIALVLGNIIVINIYYYYKIKIDIPRFWKEIAKISIPIIVIAILGVCLNSLFPTSKIVLLASKILIYSAIYFFVIWHKVMNEYEINLLISSFRRLKTLKFS